MRQMILMKLSDLIDDKFVRKLREPFWSSLPIPKYERFYVLLVHDFSQKAFKIEPSNFQIW